MRPPARQPASRGRSFGAVVPGEFEAWRPPGALGQQPGLSRRRRPASVGASGRPDWGPLPDDQIEEVARQAAARRANRFAARQRFLGRHRVSAPRKPPVWEALREVGRGTKLAVAALALAIGAGAVLFASPWLKVQRVEVVGAAVV